MRWQLAIMLAACSREPQRKLEIVDAPAVDNVARLAASERTKAMHDGKQLVIYVGATWCEPCRYFHDAAVAGRLDASFGDVRLLVFDADRDGEALNRGGYVSSMIPLFAIPTSDGRSSGHQIEGSVKGEGAVNQIAPRLRALIDTSR